MQQSGMRPKICLDPEEFQGDPRWRLDDIVREFVYGFRFLMSLEREVTIFGSARTAPSSRWYKEARKLGYILAEDGYTVITGGGSGIMEAANRGASEYGVKTHEERSVGIDIVLPHGVERKNPYVDRRMAFHYFFTRKVMLSASAQAYIFFPGGFGTMDEFWEMLTLLQTKKMEQVPVACIGKKYWDDVKTFMVEHMTGKEKMISEEDFNLFHIVDTAEEVLDIVRTSKERKFF